MSASTPEQLEVMVEFARPLMAQFNFFEVEGANGQCGLATTLAAGVFALVQPGACNIPSREYLEDPRALYDLVYDGRPWLRGCDTSWAAGVLFLPPGVKTPGFTLQRDLPLWQSLDHLDLKHLLDTYESSERKLPLFHLWNRVVLDGRAWYVDWTARQLDVALPFPRVWPAPSLATTA